MRKRKQPVGLYASLGVLLFGGLVFNLFQAGILKPPAPQSEARQTNPGEAKSIAEKVKSATSSVKPMAPKAAGGGPANAGKLQAASAFRKSLNGRPLMAMPKPTDFKPTPNDSSTSTQWYREDSRSFDNP